MSNIDDYQRLPELLNHYYTTMTASSPAWVKGKVSLAEIESDLAVLMVLLFTSGMTQVFMGMVNAVPHDHPLIKLISQWPRRMAAANQALDTMSHVKALIGSPTSVARPLP